jgi:hypothetical protein
MSRDSVDIVVNSLADSESHSRVNVADSLARAANLRLAKNTAQQSARHVPDLSTTGAKESLAEMAPDSGFRPSPIPSSIRAPTHLLDSQRRSTSFSTNGTFQQSGSRNGILADLRARTAPASSSLEQKQKTLLDNMAQLQRMDFVKARTGSVLSRGFILKTDFYPSGEHLCHSHSIPTQTGCRLISLNLFDRTCTRPRY